MFFFELPAIKQVRKMWLVFGVIRLLGWVLVLYKENKAMKNRQKNEEMTWQIRSTSEREKHRKQHEIDE
jgi:hypothetical protein